MTWSGVSLEPGGLSRVAGEPRKIDDFASTITDYEALLKMLEKLRSQAEELRGDESGFFECMKIQTLSQSTCFRMFFSYFIVSQVTKGWCHDVHDKSLQIIATMGVSPFLVPASWPQQVEADGGPPKQFVKAIGALEDYIEPLVVSSYHNFPNEIPIAYWGSRNFLAYLRCLFGFGAENNFWVGLLVSSSRNLQQLLLLLQIEYFVGEAHPNV